jgi:putative N6-adenine-specific DNA methylase
VAPGMFRDRFGFETWRDFDEKLLDELMAAAEANQKTALTAFVGGSDSSEDFIEQARSNARACSVDRHVQFLVQDLADVEAPAESGVLMCNPPYGERIGNREELGAFYKALGDVLKQRFRGWTAFVLSGNKELAQSIRLKSAQRIPVDNGGIQCQLMKYELY